MKQSLIDLEKKITSLLGSKVVDSKLEFDEVTLELAPDDLVSSMTKLKDEAGFDMLIDLCGVDYLTYGQANWESAQAANTGFSRGVFDFEKEQDGESLNAPRRFTVVYHLLSIENNQRIRIKVFPADTKHPIVASVIDVWSVANWFEREAFDLYGILFEGHPDLRRILTDYGFVGYPLRKDFPLVGHVEMRYDSEKQRVIYEPVSIENRVNVPRVIRH